MNVEEKQAVYAHAANEWGIEAQMRACQEECAELIVAVNHFIRVKETIANGKPVGPETVKRTQESLIEELADAEITIEQVRGFVDAAAVDAVKIKKLRRMQERLEMTPWS